MSIAALRCRNLVETRLLHLALRARGVRLRDDVPECATQAEAVRGDWHAVAARLADVERHESPELTARALCCKLVGLPEVDSATILVFGPGDIAVPLAVVGPAIGVLQCGQPIPEQRARYLRNRVRAGPWVENWESRPEDGEYGYALARASLAGAMYGPLCNNGAIVGVLAAGSFGSTTQQRLAARLPTIVEFAALAGALLGPDIARRQTALEARSAVRRVIHARAFRSVFQPIVELVSGEIVGYEALTRFADGVPPDRRFAEATEAGLTIELEIACLQAALDAARDLPSDRWISLNVSPQLVLEHDPLATALLTAQRPVTLEITEHLPIEDYGMLRASLERLESVRFAVDDAGAGFASFRHILELGPDLVKLDRGIVQGIESDAARQAFVAGMSQFASTTGCTLVAEGVETVHERAKLQELGVLLGQGYLFGRPAPVTMLRHDADRSVRSPRGRAAIAHRLAKSHDR